MNKKLIIGIFILLIGYSSFSQDIHFSQWYEAPLLLNPANAGSYFGDYRANLNYRNQWATVGNSYKTMLASYDMPILKNEADIKTTGIGISFYSDKAGKTNYGRTEAKLSLSQSVILSGNANFSVGLGVSYGQISGNFNNLKWDSQYDGTKYDASLPTGENTLNTKSTYLDGSAGLLLRLLGTKKNETNIGVSILNVSQTWKSTLASNKGVDQRRMRIIAHIKSELLVSKNRNDFIVPTLFYSSQGGSNVIGVGGTYKLNLGIQSYFTGYYTSSFLEFGAIYRVQDAVVAIVKYDWKQKIQLGLSYDVNISKLRVSSAYQGGFEISLVYKGSFN